MLVGMEGDLLRRYSKYHWLDLPQRWFRSIGYQQKIHSLKSYSHYVSLNRTTTRALSGPSNLAAIPTVQQALSAEIDLSDSSLEMKLRDLLEQYSQIHKMIFIFDELDKLPKEINLEDLVLYMKNLFAETGVYAFFVTDENSLKRIIGMANTQPPTELSTLFVDHLLLNNMSGEEFEEVIRMRVFDVDESKFNELVAALTLRTHRSPHELSKVLIRTGSSYDSLIAQLKMELGEVKFGRYGVMQRLADYVSSLYVDLFDDPYYRRTLSAALEDAGSIILASDSNYVDQTAPWTLFYTTELFSQEGQTKEQTDAIELSFKSDRGAAAPVMPAIVTTIEERSNEQSRTIYAAVATLLVLLNRTLMIASTKTIHPDALTIGQINFNQFTHANLDNIDLQKAFNLTENEEKILKKLRVFNGAYKSLTGVNIYGEEHVISPLKIDDLGVAGKYSLSNVQARWREHESIAKSTDEMMISAFIEDVNKHINPQLVSYSRTKNDSTFELSSGDKIHIITLFGRQPYKVFPDSKKTFILRDPSAIARQLKQTSQVKNFKMTDKWTNHEYVARQVAEWINKHGV